MLTANVAERVRFAFDRYLELRDLNAVGREMHISRQRVGQLLTQGESLGLFRRPDFARAPKIARERVLDALQSALSLKSAAQLAGCSERALRYAVDFFELNYAVAALEQRRHAAAQRALQDRLIAEYDRAVRHIGHHPTVSEMHRYGYSSLYVRIVSAFGGIGAFRDARTSFATAVPQ